MAFRRWSEGVQCLSVHEPEAELEFLGTVICLGESRPVCLSLSLVLGRV